MMATETIRYDRSNRQIDYQYMARIKDSDKLAIGYVVIEKGWYEPESNWKYYIFYNEYAPGGMCGGAVNKGIEKVEVEKDTIIPFNQVAKIIWNIEHEISVDLDIKDGKYVISGISKLEFFPYEFWSDSKRLVEKINNYDKNNVVEKKNEYLEMRKEQKKNSFESFINGIKERELYRKRGELYAAITNFWNENISKYKGIYIGIDGDVEYIKENDNGKIISSLLDGVYQEIEGALTEFVKLINPDDVEGFNCAEERESVG